MLATPPTAGAPRRGRILDRGGGRSCERRCLGQAREPVAFASVHEARVRRPWQSKTAERRRSSQPHSRSRLQWGGELIWVAGYTSGGAPYGLRVCDFDRAEIEAMGLDVAALHDAWLLTAASEPSDEPKAWPRGDIPF
jgi:hypothetical protein